MKGLGAYLDEALSSKGSVQDRIVHFRASFPDALAAWWEETSNPAAFVFDGLKEAIAPVTPMQRAMARLGAGIAYVDIHNQHNVYLFRGTLVMTAEDLADILHFTKNLTSFHGKALYLRTRFPTLLDRMAWSENGLIRDFGVRKATLYTRDAAMFCAQYLNLDDPHGDADLVANHILLCFLQAERNLTSPVLSEANLD